MNSTDIVKEFLDAENRRDWVKWASFLSSHVEYIVIGSEASVKGKDSYILKMKSTYSELSDWKFNILNILGNNEIVFVEFVGSGHFTGQEDGRDYKNVLLNLNALDIFKLKDDFIYEIREYFDYRGYKQQLSSR